MLDNARYRPWQGQLRPAWVGSLAIARVGLQQVLRRKSYWIVLGLGLLHFLVIWAVIYAVTQFQIPDEARGEFLRRAGFSPALESTGQNGYVMFMERQSLAVMMLLAFSGSLLVGSDFRLKSLPFYLARRIDRRHYILGKLLAVSAVICLMTVLPAMLLFLEYGLFTSSFSYWIENWRIPLSILAYGGVMCAALSILLVALSAYLQKMAPIAIIWSSVFVLLKVLATQLRQDLSSPNWLLLDPWHNISTVGRLAFGQDLSASDTPIWASVAILAVACGLALVALTRRVRAVDVVT